MGVTKFPNGVGADTSNYISTSGIYLGGTLVTATAAELNAAAGTGVSSTELDLLDGALAGTAVANKALALGATKNVDTIVIADGGLYLGAGAGTSVSATAAELNLLDLSAQTETILVAGAVSVTKRVSNLSAASGAYAVTLAAPDATMLGQVKVIQMTVAGNAITMALTNVQGGSAGTSASFDAVDETLILVAGTNKWNVIKEVGVTLS